MRRIPLRRSVRPVNARRTARKEHAARRLQYSGRMEASAQAKGEPQMELTRRSLLAGSAAAAAAAGSIAAIATADEAAAQQADLVIVGEGMGGLTAGVRALQNGIASVTIVEASNWPGGGSSFSNGSIHAFGMGNSVEKYRENSRHMSVSDLATKSFVAISDFINWVGTLGLPFEVADPTDRSATSAGGDDDLPSGQMLSVDGQRGATAPINFFRSYEALFVELGGTIMHATSAIKIETDELNRVAGVLCTTREGERFVIQTSNVILACGGWQNDPEMKCRFFGQDGWQAGVMGTPYNNASGIALAEPLGAKLDGDFTQFAGLFLPAHPAKNFMEDVEMYEANDYTYDEGGKWWMWREMLDMFPARSILVNNQGKRFTDEGKYRHSGDADIARQTHATAIIICDEPVYQNWLDGVVRGMPEGEGMREKVEFIQTEACGGAVFQADTIEELADALNASEVASYMVNKANLIKTVEEYNAAAEAGTAAELEVERITNDATPIVEPPFHAVPIRNAIFVTYGGLAINDSAQVLDIASNPIPGLYATTPCAGGVMHEFYCGSIAHAGVTGMWAADAVAAKLLG